MPIEIARRLKAVYGDVCMDVKNIRQWAVRAKTCNRGDMGIFDKERPGRPISVTCDENQARVDAMIQGNRRIKQREIALELGISQERVQHIIQLLNYRKICARWVPRQLTDAMKEIRMQTCQNLLERCRREGHDFLHNVATGDESWVHHYDPENKRQSMEYRRPESPSVRKFKRIPSAQKVMLTIFWDARGVIHREYLSKGMTVNSGRYCETLRSLKSRIRRIRPERTEFLLHHDNARPHCSKETMSTISRLGFEVVPHPPYSPDLAPSDFWLFPKLKEVLKGKHFSSDAEVERAVTEWIKEQQESFFADGFSKWVLRMEKCVAHNGDYVEK